MTPFLSVALSGAAATCAGIGLARFAFVPLFPALVEAGWVSGAEAGLLGAATLAGYLPGVALAPRLAARLGTRPVLFLKLLFKSFFRIYLRSIIINILRQLSNSGGRGLYLLSNFLHILLHKRFTLLRHPFIIFHTSYAPHYAVQFPLSLAQKLLFFKIIFFIFLNLSL